MYEIQQNHYVCKYFYYCVCMCSLFNLSQGDWHKKSNAEIFSLREHITKQVVKMSKQ